MHIFDGISSLIISLEVSCNIDDNDKNNAIGHALNWIQLVSYYIPAVAMPCQSSIHLILIWHETAKDFNEKGCWGCAVCHAGLLAYSLQ